MATGQKRKLSAAAAGAIAAYEEGRADLYVPAGVVVETWFLSQGGVIRLDTTLSRWWGRITNARLHLVDLTASDVFTAASLGWEHRDPYDRMIVATALRLGLPLLSADTAIAEWGGVEILW